MDSTGEQVSAYYAAAQGVHDTGSRKDGYHCARLSPHAGPNYFGCSEGSSDDFTPGDGAYATIIFSVSEERMVRRMLCMPVPHLGD